MALPQALNFTTKFELKNKNFLITDTTDYAAEVIFLSEIVGILTIIAPDGTKSYENTDFNSPDIDPASQITAVDTVNEIFTIAGDRTSKINDGDTITVILSVFGHNGDYTVATNGVNLVGGNTEITVEEDIQNASVDGHLLHTKFLENNSISLPLDSAGKIQQGTYKITYTINVTEIEQEGEYSKTSTFEYTFDEPVVKIETTVDCFCATLESKDQTTYTVDGVTPTITRTHDIFFPAFLEKSKVTGSGISLKVVHPDLFKGTYSTKISSVLVYSFTDHTIDITVEGTKETEVDCDLKLCDIYCGVRNLNNRYLDNLKANPTKADQEFQKLERVTQLMELFAQAQQCGKQADAAKHLTEIQDVAEFESGCSCTDGEPIQILPFCGFDATGTVVVDAIAGKGIVVTSDIVGNTTTYSIGLTDAIKAKIDGLHVVTVSAGTNIGIQVNGTDPKDYKVTFTGPVDTIVKMLSVLFIIEPKFDPTITIKSTTLLGGVFRVPVIQKFFPNGVSHPAKYIVEPFYINPPTTPHYKASISLMNIIDKNSIFPGTDTSNNADADFDDKLTVKIKAYDPGGLWFGFFNSKTGLYYTYKEMITKFKGVHLQLTIFD